MTATYEAPSLYPEVQETTTPPGRGQHGYYRRSRDGWIITAGVWPSFRADMEFKGLTFLPQFGTWTMSGPGLNTNVTDRRGMKFNPAEEPWRLIFQHPDGAAAFPVSQVIAYRWHLRPPYREVTFPQLGDLKVYDFFCPECEKGIFSAPDEREAMEMLRIHLTSRFDEPHSYRPEDLRALGQELNIDFFAPRRRAHRPEAVVEAPTLQAPEPAPDLTLNDAVVKTKKCPDCGQEVEIANFAFARHAKAHKKETSAAPA